MVIHLYDFLKNSEKQPLMRMFSLKHDFPNEWHQLMNPTTGTTQKTEIEIKQNHFPYMFSNRTITVNETNVYLIPKVGKTIAELKALMVNDEPLKGVTWKASHNSIRSSEIPLINFNPLGILTIITNSEFIEVIEGKDVVRPGNNGLKKNEVDDVLIVFNCHVG